IKAAASPHHFLSVTKAGHSAIVSTNGNEDCHVILRGGRVPNYDAASVDAAATELGRAGVAARRLIATTHAHSSHKPEHPPLVAADIAKQVAAGEQRIIGVMIESNLVAGRQDVVPGKPLTYGQSITDGCIDLATTADVLKQLADAVDARRGVRRDGLQERSA
ncbi:MAG: 3-deoxy-7-phosphoheptulonate synthase, partial [Bradyrhizobium sp.]